MIDDSDEDMSDEDDRDCDEDPDADPEECCLGSDCLNPHPYHLASECFDLEMAEAYQQDGEP